MQRYVLGFMFSNDEKRRVVLIQKKRPDWMAGKLNGVGEKFDLATEDPHTAMVREFEEETGVKTNRTDWTAVAKLVGSDDNDPNYHEVWVFVARSPRAYQTRGITDELVAICDVKAVTIGALNTLPNVPWLVSMCLCGSRSLYTIREEEL